jgi:hypothetical protein
LTVSFDTPIACGTALTSQQRVVLLVLVKPHLGIGHVLISWPLSKPPLAELLARLDIKVRLGDHRTRGGWKQQVVVGKVVGFRECRGVVCKIRQDEGSELDDEDGSIQQHDARKRRGVCLPHKVENQALAAVLPTREIQHVQQHRGYICHENKEEQRKERSCRLDNGGCAHVCCMLERFNFNSPRPDSLICAATRQMSTIELGE